MQRFRIVYTETARADLIAIGDYIRDAAGDVVADRFIGRVIATVESLETSPPPLSRTASAWFGHKSDGIPQIYDLLPRRAGLSTPL